MAGLRTTRRRGGLRAGGARRYGWVPLLAGLVVGKAVLADDGAQAHAAPPDLTVAQAATDEPANLRPVTVTGSQTSDLRDKTRRAAVGPLGERDLVDSPYALSVVPAELFNNQQRKSVPDALRYLPTVQADAGRPALRGIQGSVIENSRLDGFNVVSTTDYPLEMFDRIEVLNSVAGSLYGPSNAAGTFNFVQKRAGRDMAQRFTVGVTGRGALLGHADVATALNADGSVRLRANVLQDIGEAYVDDSHLRRSLGAFALDADLAPGTRLYLNASRYQFAQRGLPGVFSAAAGVRFPQPLDPERAGYGQSYAGNRNQTDTASARLEHDLGAGWTLNAGLLRQIADRQFTVVTNTVTNAAGAYTTSGVNSGASRFTVTSNLIQLRGKMVTGELNHEFVVANTGYDWSNFNPIGAVGAAGSITLGSASLSAPAFYRQPVYPDYGNRYRTALQRAQSLILADTIRWGERWQFMLSTAYSKLSADTFNNTGATTRSSTDSGFSPGASVLYKTSATSSVYASYADTLQPGDVSPATDPVSPNQPQPAYRSKQIEFGYKTRLSGIDWSAAVFQIERPFAYADPTFLVGGRPVFRTVGQQVNRGLELSAVGSVTRELTVFGGVALLDPTIRKSVNPASEGQRIVGLPPLSVSVSGDLRIPAVQGLSLNARVIAIGRRPADNANTDAVAGYATTDLGLRWDQNLLGRTTTFRLSVNNVADKRFWTNVVPGGLGGYSGSGTTTANVGAPRSLQASLQWEL